MSHEWYRGVLTASSWHGLETVGVMADAPAMIQAGERSMAWPLAIHSEGIVTASGLPAPGTALVASYFGARDHALAVNGDRYRATQCDEWRNLVTAAVAAGAKPTGAFALRGGTRVLATFEVGTSNGLRTQLVLADAFDGTMHLTAGFSSIRVVCANTLSAAMRSDGRDMAKLRHTASLEQRVRLLESSIAETVKAGDNVRAMYERAEATALSREQASAILDKLFPVADKDAPKAAQTRADNARSDAARAMARAENNVGSTLATVWNAATWLVDRDARGEAKMTRGGSSSADMLDSLLFGARAERVSEIQTIIEVILKDGTVEAVPAVAALAMGADKLTIGRKVLDDMLADL